MRANHNIIFPIMNRSYIVVHNANVVRFRLLCSTGLFMFILHLCLACSESFSRLVVEYVGFQSGTWMPRPRRVSAGAERVMDSTGGHLEEIRDIACHGHFNTLM